MSEQPTPRRAPQPPRDLRRRVLRHYLPLAVASAAILVALMSLSLFDANKYAPPAAIFSGDVIDGVFPADQPAGSGAPMQMGQGGSPAMNHGAGQAAAPPMNHSGAPAGTPSAGHSARGGGGGPPEQIQLMRRLSTTTGYLALGLLALTLLIGPGNLLLGRRNPLSSYLRRDIGIWTTIISVAHVVFGFLVKHGGGGVIDYFVAADGSLLGSSFGVANYTGAAATVIVVGVAAVSSNAALKKLTARNWKRLQRLNYALFALVIVHALTYGALWRTASPYTRLLALCVVTVILGQAAGVWLYRRRHPRAVAQHA